MSLFASQENLNFTKRQSVRVRSTFPSTIARFAKAIKCRKLTNVVTVLANFCLHDFRQQTMQTMTAMIIINRRVITSPAISATGRPATTITHSKLLLQHLLYFISGTGSSTLMLLFHVQFLHAIML